MQITLPVTSRVRVQLRELHHILWDIVTVDSEENKVIGDGTRMGVSLLNQHIVDLLMGD